MTGGVRKKGAKWYYYFDTAKVDGKRQKIERVGGKTKKEAEAIVLVVLLKTLAVVAFRIEESNLYHLVCWVKMNGMLLLRITAFTKMLMAVFALIPNCSQSLSNCAFC